MPSRRRRQDASNLTQSSTIRVWSVGFKQVVAEEGVGAADRFGTYRRRVLHQGWFKFGGVEFFKINQAQYYGDMKQQIEDPNLLATAAC